MAQGTREEEAAPANSFGGGSISVAYRAKEEDEAVLPSPSSLPTPRSE